jgi:hypothetical protein
MAAMVTAAEKSEGNGNGEGDNNAKTLMPTQMTVHQ